MSLVRLIVCTLMAVALSGCALGKKEWPTAVKEDERFGMTVVSASRHDQCLSVVVQVSGAKDLLYRASLQFESVGEGGGCPGCPFVPRDAIHVVRGQESFSLQDEFLSLELCELQPGIEYRFRIAGKSELANIPLVYTDTYAALP